MEVSDHSSFDLYMSYIYLLTFSFCWQEGKPCFCFPGIKVWKGAVGNRDRGRFSSQYTVAPWHSLQFWLPLNCWRPQQRFHSAEALLRNHRRTMRLIISWVLALFIVRNYYIQELRAILTVLMWVVLVC